ncbi:MAG TPA: hypothetical protein VNQ80_00965 [Parapedobacter sp.]|uniref:hypothetical protein n=1 Tax=Parapedobacter sp. TaxID=1958893 RepID=UPI002BD4196E|nr:hypothetical protein [Parapedobacter sp.]HWK55872.1 hypothetical protein [Parapedobacter sp.]
MDAWVIGFAVAGIALSALSIVLRIIDYYRWRDLAELLLSVALFAIMWYAFIYMMVLTGYIVYIPNLYNKGIPLYYLIAPCTYFYAWLKLQRRRKLARYWYLHLLPFVFGLIDIMPYALSSAVEKQALMAQLTSNMRMGFEHEYGFIDQQWHYVIRLVLSFAYLLAQWRLLFLADTEEGGVPKQLLYSLYALTVIYSLFIALQVSMILNILFNQIQASYILKDAHQLIWISGFYLLFSIWVCFALRFRRSGNIF